MPQIHFAPMQGYADVAYRRLHAAIYGDIDCYYTPFIRLEKGTARLQDISRLKEALADSRICVPQIIFNSPEEFAILSEEICGLGVNRIDLNLGCPYPMQTSRGRGAAMLGRPDIFARVADAIRSNADVTYSVKMRIGFKDPSQWRDILPILNDLRLAHIAIHPRIASQLYAGNLHLDQFAELLSQSANPIVYNGEIRTANDINDILNRFPGLHGVMIGRGLLANPALATEWRQGRQLTPEERSKRLMQFHDALLAEYERTLCGPTQILQHIKPFWEYLQHLIPHKTAKAIRKASTIATYRTIIAQIDGNLR